VRPRGHHPCGPAGDHRGPRRASRHPLPPRRARVRPRHRRAGEGDPVGGGRRGCGRLGPLRQMHRQGQLRAAAGRPTGRAGDQPGQARAKPRRDIPGVLPGIAGKSLDHVMAAYLFALRLGRWGIAGFGAVAFVVALVQTVGFYKIAGGTQAERQAFGRSMSILATQFTVIIPPPVRPDTVGGYVQWRAFGFLAILFAIWALASAGGAARGDEERGIVQVLLATGLSRPRAIVSRVGAFATTSMVAALAAGAG